MSVKRRNLFKDSVNRQILNTADNFVTEPSEHAIRNHVLKESASNNPLSQLNTTFERDSAEKALRVMSISNEEL